MAAAWREQDEARRGEWQRTCLGHGRGGAADVGLVELELGRELDESSGRVPDRRQAVSDVVVAAAVSNATCLDEGSVERVA